MRGGASRTTAVKVFQTQYRKSHNAPISRTWIRAKYVLYIGIDSYIYIDT